MAADTAEQIAFLEGFKADIQAHFNGSQDGATRVRINRGMARARGLVVEAGVMKTVTLSPPAAIGGILVRNADPFNYILQDYYGMSMSPTVADMIDEAIGVFESPDWEQKKAKSATRSENVTPPMPVSIGELGRSIPAALATTKDPELPEKVTISWLVRHVPMSFWLWLAGILAAVFAAGAKLGPLLK